MNPARPRRWRVLAALVTALLMIAPVSSAGADDEVYQPVSGSGSTWSANAVSTWAANVAQYGWKVNYADTGSSDGRKQFAAGTVDFALSEIPYGRVDGAVVDNPPARGYAYMPIVAGGTALMYNLKIGNGQVTNLRLSGEVITKIFTGVITQWNDEAIAKENPSLALPALKIVPVVRTDGSGTSAQFTAWMHSEHGGLWKDFCGKVGRAGSCTPTSNYPVFQGFVGQNGSLGVSGYVSQPRAQGTITYVEYSYALNTGFPVVKVLNKAGYYVEPTASAVAVALLRAKINTNERSPDYLVQQLDGVYRSDDPRSYPMSSYSYMIMPTKVENNFTEDKGRTLSSFAYYFLCQGQQQADVLGYSPLPKNLVEAGLDQVRRIPGVKVNNIDIKKCNNPTFSADGTNVLAANAPQPPACDKTGAEAQCTTGTGGNRNETKPTRNPNNPGPTPTTPGTAPTQGGNPSPGEPGGPQAPPTGGENPTPTGPDGGQAPGGETPATDPGATPSTDGPQAPVPDETDAPTSGGSSGPATTTAATTTAATTAATTTAAVETSDAELPGVIDDPALDTPVGEDPADCEIDPDTGACRVDAAADPLQGQGISMVYATPVSLDPADSSMFTTLLMTIAVVLLLTLMFLPPYLGKRLAGRASRPVAQAPTDQPTAS